MTLIQALLIALVAALGQAAGDIGGNVMVNRADPCWRRLSVRS